MTEKGYKMKLIHCADIHLNSSLSTHLDGDKQKLRRTEILHTFLRMVDYAAEQSVDGILIAGDLFDTKRIDRTTGNAVLSAITEHPDILFFYLRGNHDMDGFLQSLPEIPDNLKLFGDTWRSYAWEEQGETIVITGAESSAGNAQTLYASLQLNPANINLVMLHGQEMPYASGAGQDAEQIPLRLLQNKGIDYLALGHIHTYKREKLDARGIYVYPGCLEGRGFDECGVHGFCLLEIDAAHHKLQDTFVPFAGRRLWETSVDVSTCANGVDVLENMKEALQERQVQASDLVKVCLTGSLPAGVEVDTELLAMQLSQVYFYVKVVDQTVPEIDYAAYAYDASLKGEFVRLVQAQTDLSDAEKAKIIQTGILALAGEAFV